MPHNLPGALQQAGWIRQRCAVKEPNVHVRCEYIHVTEGCISQTRDGTAVMHEVPDFVAAISHGLKPVLRDASQCTWMILHPLIDSRIPLDSAIESQQIRSRRCHTLLPARRVVTQHHKVAWSGRGLYKPKATDPGILFTHPRRVPTTIVCARPHCISRSTDSSFSHPPSD